MKAKLKKLIPLLLSVVMCGSLIAGCTEQHTHSYKWVSNGAEGHHQECVDGDDVKDEIKAHNYGNDDKCDDCGYTKPGTSDTVAVTEVTLNKTSTSIVAGQTEQLTATVAPETATNKKVTWDSSDKTVATVSATGLVTALKAGTTTITVTTEDGNKTATCAVTVTAAQGGETTVNSITLNKNATTIKVGATETLTATVDPTTATVTWESSNTAVATVAGGVVTAVAVGTATITAKAGGKTATCEVTVEAATQGGGEVDPAPLPTNNKIFLVGDSTVCSFNDSTYYMPRYGYGTQIAEYFDVKPEQVVNLAASGRSSYSLMIESASNYATLTSETDGLKKGDYLIIGFGHNDEKAEVARYADPTLASDNATTKIGTYETNRAISFKYILKTYYIDVALSKGAIPILCTPISRLFEDKDEAKYTTDHITGDKDVVVDGTTVHFTGGDYAKAIKELGEELDVTVVDLKTLTGTEYKTLGYAEASKYHAATGAKWADESKSAKQATGIDGTHTNSFGARNNAYYLANAILSSSNELRNHVKENISKPTYAEFGAAAVNDDYKIVEKDSFNPEKDASKIWTGVTGSITDKTTSAEYKWYGTAFGSGVKASNFTITQGSDANGITFTITADKDKGKIESKQDILAAVFIQVPMKTAFKITATANVSGLSGKQSGYGIMVRDDIYIDDFTSTVASNYLNAGCYTTDTSAYVLHWRINSALGKSKTVDGLTNVNGSHNLAVTRLSQNTTLEFDSYNHKMLEDTYNLDLSDGDYVYICLWATRGMSVTYSNIKFETLEWEQA